MLPNIVEGISASFQMECSKEPLTKTIPSEQIYISLDVKVMQLEIVYPLTLSKHYKQEIFFNILTTLNHSFTIPIFLDYEVQQNRLIHISFLFQKKHEIKINRLIGLIRLKDIISTKRIESSLNYLLKYTQFVASLIFKICEETEINDTKSGRLAQFLEKLEKFSINDLELGVNLQTLEKTIETQYIMKNQREEIAMKQQKQQSNVISYV